MWKIQWEEKERNRKWREERKGKRPDAWAAEGETRKESWIWGPAFTSQLCPFLACMTFGLSVDLHQIAFKSCGNHYTSLKECWSDMMGVKVLGLIKRDEWNRSQCLGMIAERNWGSQARDGSRMGRKHLKESVLWDVPTQQSSRSEKSWTILLRYPALPSTPLQLVAHISGSLIFTRTI